VANLGIFWKELFDRIWSSYEPKLSDIISNLGRYRSLIESQHTIFEIEERRREEDKRFEAGVKNEDMRRAREVSNWLRSTDVETNQFHLSKIRADCPGTGRWLLNNSSFKEWFDPQFPTIPPLLWLNGIPGAGKTILASLVVDEVKQLPHSPTVLFFYCKHKNSEQDNFIALARSLLVQLLSQNKGLLLYFYEKCCYSGETILKSEALMEELMLFAFKNCKSAYIIIDGIDECPREERKRVVRWFRKLVEDLPINEPERLRCLFISQDDGPARKDFSGLSSITIGLEDSTNDGRPMGSTYIPLSGGSSRVSPLLATHIQETENFQRPFVDRQGREHEQEDRISSLLRDNKAIQRSYASVSEESRQLHILLHRVAGLVAESSQGAEEHDNFSPLPLLVIEDESETDQLLLSVRDDWSGRGSHATFTHEETIPLEKGRTLGYGINGEVVEVICKGVKLALKMILHRPSIQNGQMKEEIEVLKKIKHHHIVQLVGTYTQRPYLGLLVWPVARCDLSLILEVMDLRGLCNQKSSQDHGFSQKLAEHHLSMDEFQDIVGQEEERMWSIFGCLTAAIAYLHQNNIRHKDIKPSNIILSRDGLWLADFGAARDFTSDLTSSSESRERGTLRYCAPEVYNYEKSGRSADIFSLGCVFLETMVVLAQNHTLAELEELRPSKNKSYEANLDQIDQWLVLAQSTKTKMQNLLYEIKLMLNHDGTRRPTAKALALRISNIDQHNGGQLPKRLHGSCCELWFERGLNVDEARIEKLERKKLEYEK
jgi:serine/threonine protein kinase